MGVADFRRAVGTSEISWANAGRPVRKTYEQQVTSAVVLRDGSGVAVVEPVTQQGERNAVVFNADGSERCRLERPCRADDGCHFAQIDYVRDELTVVVVIHGTNFAYVFEPVTGAYIRHYETR